MPFEFFCIMLVQSGKNNFRHFGYKTSEYEFYTHTTKLFNQSTLNIGYIVLIGCFLNTGKFYDCKARV